MDSGTELMEALSLITSEKGIDKNIVFEAIETSLISACKKNFGSNADIKVRINEETGRVQVVTLREVVNEVEDANIQISLKDAEKIKIGYNIGDILETEVAPRNFGRITAQAAKQVVVQKFREAERDILFQEFIAKEHDVISGVVQRRERRNVIIALEKIEAILPPSEQVQKETYAIHDRIKVYVTDVKQSGKGPIINVSRTSPDLVKRLFEQEVPEIYDGTVEVKSISREPGIRSKIAVYSKNPHVDPVGACVGQNGHRVNLVSTELKGEKIDVINWNRDPVKYISAALSPSKVKAVAVNPEEMAAKVIVPDHQLSLAIGKEGQNARLATRLTGWRINIKSESQAKEMDFITEEELNFDYEAYISEKEKLKQMEEAKAKAEAVEAALEAAALEAEKIAEPVEEPEVSEVAKEIEEVKEEAAEAAEEKEEKTEEVTIVPEEKPEEAAPAGDNKVGNFYEEQYDDEYYDDEYDDDYYDDEYDDGYYDEYDDSYYDYEDDEYAVAEKTRDAKNEA